MYNSNTGIITSPVSIKDVQQALGRSETDLGSLITNGNINMWARYKPVWYLGLDTPIATAKSASYSGYNSRSGNMPDNNPNHVDGDYGIACSYVYQGTNNQALSHYADIMQAGWTYARPRGSGYTDIYGKIPACPFRLTDFVGYNGNATPPIWLNNPSIRVNSTSSSRTFYITINIIEANDDDSVVGLETLTNSLLNLKKAKFCIIVNKYNGASGNIFEASKYIMQADGSVDGAYSIPIGLDARAADNSSLFATSATNKMFACIKVYQDDGSNPIWIALPQSPAHPNQGTITTYYNQAEVGLAITSVYVAPNVDCRYISNFRSYNDISEEQDGRYSMYSSTGTIIFAICFQNDGTQANTFNRTGFTLSDYGYFIAGDNTHPYAIYVGDDMTTRASYDIVNKSVNSFTIGAKKYKWVCLHFEGVFSTSLYNKTTKGSSTELLLKYQNVTLRGDVLYVFRGTGGEGFVSL